ncbi:MULTISPECIES: RcgA family putative transporter [Litoreibacter]|uniref:Transmembrane protein n=1 Tax=Litoreibacter ascidiaceicola TaxID=1486859 RepID=A0A1M5DK82_9RHOB|nr:MULTISPECIES: hypothetical protein [Litoreibacter]SHF67409.1 hypothetical protein SAMN05444273_10984 [Litoreibacter ascidiaceicola]
MIKNDKFFVAPTHNGLDFKTLFNRLSAAGAGRPMEKDGFSPSPWTAELLADAISQIDENGSGIELRTVQLWFQDNDRGVSPDNLRWLARIFGCDDPVATSQWQIELAAAQSKLATNRRERKEAERRAAEELRASAATSIGPVAKAIRLENEPGPRKRSRSLAARSEALFSETDSLNLPIAIWACGGLLWFLVYIAGVHSITYSLVTDQEKQVGFLWAPSWTVDRMVFIPLFTIAVGGLLNFWKKEQRLLIILGNPRTTEDASWTKKLETYAFPFWAILCVCFVIVFLVQWAGVYLRPLSRGTIGDSMVDWILVAVVRPDVVSITEAIVLSGLANLYSAFAYWCYFTGLLFLFIVVNDFCQACSEQRLEIRDEDRRKVFAVGGRVLGFVFRCTILGLFSATSIKLNAVYLISDAENILVWMTSDALTAMGLRHEEWGWLTRGPSAYMTSFFVLFITCFIFLICLAQTYRALEQVSAFNEASASGDTQLFKSLLSASRVSWLKMTVVVGLLVVNFILIGQFTGFSILLAVSVLVATYSLIIRI